MEALPPSLTMPVALETLLCWRWPLALFERACGQYGNTFTLRLVGQPPFVFFSDRRDVATVLEASPGELTIGRGAQVLTPIIGSTSFMLADDHLHHDERSAALRSLPLRPNRLVDCAWEEAMRGAIEAWPVDVPTPLEDRLRSLILGAILARIFGSDHGALPALHERFQAMLSSIPTFLLQEPYLRSLPGCRGRWNAFMRRREAADDLLLSCLREPQPTDGGPGHDRTLQPNSETFGAAGRTRDNVTTMIVAGHETTAGTLAWALELLAHHPRAQERLAGEIDAGEGAEYLKATVREVLRHRPVFPFTIPREVRDSFTVGGRRYASPTHLLGSIYLAHHDPELYDEPHEFRPERFLGEATPSPYAWMPWGGGRHHCPGHTLATYQIEAILSAVLSSYRLTPASRKVERPRWRGAILTPHAGARVILHRRHRAARCGRATSGRAVKRMG